jgi:hypothetical protein
MRVVSDGPRPVTYVAVVTPSVKRRPEVETQCERERHRETERKRQPERVLIY